MSAPLYFLPGVDRDALVTRERVNHGALTPFGLDLALADVNDADELLRVTPTGSTPSGKPGTIVYVGGPGQPSPDRFGYFPAQQTWHDYGRLWIGLDQLSPVKPADLVRHGTRRDAAGVPLAPCDGHQVALGDGNLWEIPIIRRPNGSTLLPRKFDWRDGRMSIDIESRYENVWNLTGEVIDFFLDSAKLAAEGQSRTCTLQWAADMALAALGLNYRVLPELVGLLGLVGTATWQPILGAMIDWPLIMAAVRAAEKKSDPPASSGTAGPSSQPGQQDAPPTTAPVAQA